MRTLTNDYSDCSLIRAEPDNPASPFIVAQRGADPEDPTFLQAVFYLQRDGLWIEETANGCRPMQDRYKVVFESVQDVVEVLGKMTGKPEIERIAVTAADLQAYIARLKSTTTEEIVRSFLASYRASKGAE